MTWIRVCVTEEDLTNGVRSSCYACPVALALNRATGGHWHVNVAGAEEEDMDKSIFLFQEVRAAINAFDRGEPVEPFSFSIWWPV